MNGDVDLGGLDHRDRVVDSGMGDVIAPFSKSIALFGGVGSVDQLDGKPALGEEALRLRCELRKVRHAGENDDHQLSLRRRGTCRCHDSRHDRTDHHIPGAASGHHILSLGILLRPQR